MFKIPLDKIYDLYVSRLWAVLPFSFVIAGLFTLIEPKTKPTFVDSTDWLAFILFILGSFAIFILHGCILYKMSAALNKGRDNLLSTLTFGFRKMPAVFLTSMITLIILPIGLVAAILPGIYFFIISMFTLFLIVIKSDLSVKNAFVKSTRLVTKHWLKITMILLALGLSFALIEYCVDWIFREAVVFSSLFFVLTRGLLWPLWYATILIMIYKLEGLPLEELIEEAKGAELSRQSRKQKFLRIFPNQL